MGEKSNEKETTKEDSEDKEEETSFTNAFFAKRMRSKNATTLDNHRFRVPTNSGATSTTQKEIRSQLHGEAARRLCRENICILHDGPRRGEME